MCMSKTVEGCGYEVSEGKFNLAEIQGERCTQNFL